EDLWSLSRLGLLLIIPLAYPIAILALLKMNVIPKPADLHLLGPTYMAWSEALDYAVGGRAEYLRDVVLMIAVPLLIVRGRSGFFFFLYLCAVWLFCLNPLLSVCSLLENTSCFLRMLILRKPPVHTSPTRNCLHRTGPRAVSYRFSCQR